MGTLDYNLEFFSTDRKAGLLDTSIALLSGGVTHNTCLDWGLISLGHERSRCTVHMLHEQHRELACADVYLILIAQVPSIFEHSNTCIRLGWWDGVAVWRQVHHVCLVVCARILKSLALACQCIAGFGFTCHSVRGGFHMAASIDSNAGSAVEPCSRAVTACVQVPNA